MGRNLEFDREETLSKAMKLFWEKGYRATSMKDIVKTTGLQPGSIYYSFGDKHSLFIEALEHYGEVITTRMIKVLNDPGDPLDNIRRFFTNLVNTPSELKSIGCLLSNTVVELSPHEEDTSRTVAKFMNKIERSFYDCLKKAKGSGDLSPDSNIKDLATYLATCTHGLIVTGKSLPSSKRINSVVDVIMSNIK